MFNIIIINFPRAVSFSFVLYSFVYDVYVQVGDRCLQQELLLCRTIQCFEKLPNCRPTYGRI